MRTITLDLETQNIFADVGSNNPALLDLSVVGIHDSTTDQCTAFTENELNKLWTILENADFLITWNGDHFDLPILNKYYPGDLNKIKHIDMMKETQKILGRRLKLDTVAEATLGLRKSGTGLDAVEWWRNGEIEKIKKYCLEDVRLTRDLYDFAKKNGYLKYKEFGFAKELKLDTSQWELPESSSMTHTLPF